MAKITVTDVRDKLRHEANLNDTKLSLDSNEMALKMLKLKPAQNKALALNILQIYGSELKHIAT